MKKSGKYFEKGNKLGFVAAGDKPLTAHVGLKLTEKDKEALKRIPRWSEKLREAVKRIIEEEGE